MKKAIILILLFSFYLAYPCSRGILQLSNFSPTNIDFNTATTHTVNFNVTHQAPVTNCLYYIVMDYGTAATWTDRALEQGANTIPFNVHKTSPPTASNIIRNRADWTTTDETIYFPVFTLLGPGTNAHSFVAQLGSVPTTHPPGVYISGLVAKLVAQSIGDPHTWPIVDEKAVTFYYVIPYLLEVAIVNTGASFDSTEIAYFMNFSDLSTGESQAADIMIQTNVGYRLYLSSDNDGVLNHTATADTIPYSLTVNGTPVNLVGSSGTPVFVSANAASHTGDGYRFPTTVTIGTVGAQSAGSYQDRITITVEAF